ncbi:MAG: permease-like cell division protein FtsX [Erysipelotrichaceae bacterium]|nr:permease-like cell division protein FtsX [Erysipelotrichaceae bacterium]
MFRALGRHIKEAFLGISRHFAMSLSAASAVTVTLLLMSILVLTIGNISQITQNLQEKVSIFVRIDESITDTEIYSLKNRVEKVEGVHSVEYSSKDNELDRLIEEFGEEGSLLEVYRGEENPLSRAFIVEVERGAKISEVSERISKIYGVEESLFGGTATEQFVESLDAIRIGGGIVVIALSLLAIFLIANTIKITIFARQDEIAIMRHVGATNGYIRTPFVIEGIIIGLIGAIIPILFTIIAYDFLYTAMDGKLITGMLTLLPVFPFTLWVSGTLVGMSVLVGWIGSLLSVNKNLRWKR